MDERQLMMYLAELWFDYQASLGSKQQTATAEGFLDWCMAESTGRA